MTCVLCGKPLPDIEQFPLSPDARKMLEKQLRIKSKKPSSSDRVCSQCSDQSPTKAG
jgi:hypothetical protein